MMVSELKQISHLVYIKKQYKKKYSAKKIARSAVGKRKRRYIHINLVAIEKYWLQAATIIFVNIRFVYCIRMCTLAALQFLAQSEPCEFCHISKII